MPDVTPLLLVDVVLAVGALELLALVALRRPALVLTLLAGLALMLALRLTVAGLALPYVALALLVSGLLHGLDLQRRWSATAGRRALSSALPVPTKENHE